MRKTKAQKKIELVAKLKELAEMGDKEVAHGTADRLLIRFIGDKEIALAFEAIEKWYA